MPEERIFTSTLNQREKNFDASLRPKRFDDFPGQEAPEYAAMYEGKRLLRRPNCQEVDPYTPTQSPPSPRPPHTCPDFQRYGNNLDEYLRLYYAMVTQVDANLGRLLDALHRFSLANNTAIVFTADHGDMQGSHGMTNKWLFETCQCTGGIIALDNR